ncbi:MAG: ABC transporter permease subunit [Candidatus Polarisedimenticolia bacterium]
MIASEPGTPGAPRRRRPRTTSPRVVWIDRIARAGITVGGIGVIAAVLAILVYLASVVSPLFLGASARSSASYALLPEADARALLFAEIDEYRLAGIALLASGESVSFEARTGRLLQRQRFVPEGTTVTCWSAPSMGGRFALGLSDGSVRTGEVAFDAELLASGEAGKDAASVIEPLDSGSRRVRPRIEMQEPMPAETAPAPARLLDYRPGETETRLAVLAEDGTLRLVEMVRRRSLRAGSGPAQVVTRPVALPAGIPVQSPSFLLLTSRGDQMYLAWEDGFALRFDLRDPDSPSVVERFDLAPGTGRTLTSLRFSLGEQSLLAGDSTGQVRAWFRVPGEGGGDGYGMAAAHTFTGSGAAVTTLAISTRDKTFLTGFSDGTLEMRHMTSERTLARMSVDHGAAVRTARLTSKGDGALAITDDGHATLWDVRNPHPETSWGSLFGRVWYEGYPSGGYTWQSSSGTDDFEPKLSLIPLIFGTLKATLYSMLFAVPIALTAAIYTSEFLDRRARSAIKPLIEMMASLPSVVLGFIAALVLAPVVENWAMAALCVFGVLPVTALAAGYLWQALPRGMTLRLSGDARLALLLLLCITAVAGAAFMAGPFERLLFGGDFRLWLAGGAGTGAPGAGVLAWPILLAGLLIADRRMAVSRVSRSPWKAALRFVAILAASVVLACLAGILASRLGFDPRGALVGSYVQRNALVVGFVMGFAVIPIIYTIAEDALSSVPQALRSASLGCGATRWQTAVRVVLPVALSGIFSAIMVGLGRAVGETMIVLMAAGNTPVMDLNIFNGLRTLSANIAVELPEAVKDGTLYRVLFLSALILFLITFVVNTVAEIVRQRFRRRAFQL